MVRAKLGLLGLCAAVLGAMSCASVAQAETGAKWLILDSQGGVWVAGENKGGTILLPSINGEIENALGSLLTEILKIKVEILCTAMKLVNMALHANGTLTTGGKVEFTGCSCDLDGVSNPNCKPLAGIVLTNALKGLVVLIGGATRVRIQPMEGETLTTMKFGAESPIGEAVPVKGTLFIQDPSIGTHLVRHLITEDAANSHMWVLNLTPEHKVTLDGSAEVFLTGADSGLSWSGDSA